VKDGLDRHPAGLTAENIVVSGMLSYPAKFKMNSVS